jgi:CBS-domain-containing membrane protein
MFDFDVRDVHAGALFASSPREAEDREMQLHPRRLFDLEQPLDVIPRRPPLILAPTCSARDALAAIGDHEQGLAMVASHGYLLGTLSEKRLLRHLREVRAWSPASASCAIDDHTAATAGRLPVWRLMQVEPETLRDTDSIGYALHKLRALDVLAMPVLNQGGALVGVLECRDLLAFFGVRAGAPRSDSVGQG